MIAADAADAQQPAVAIDAAVAHVQCMDAQVSVVGIAITASLANYAGYAFDRTFALNVSAPFLAVQRAAAVMEEGGWIIKIGSIVADRMPDHGGTLHAAGKAALGGMTRGLSRDLGARGITVNLVQPSPIDTERNPTDGPAAAANRPSVDHPVTWSTGGRRGVGGPSRVA